MSKYGCEFCGKIFTRKFNQTRHYATCDKKEQHNNAQQREQLLQQIALQREEYERALREHQTELENLRMENKRLLKEIETYDQLTDRMQEQLNAFLREAET